MLQTSRIRAPRGAPSRSVLWPVTVFRVEVLARRPEDVEDPFGGLVLDCAAAGEHDPVRIAELSGLPLDFVHDLLRVEHSHLRLDAQFRLTEAGRQHRMRQPPLFEHLGYMFRDDVTGEPLPVFIEQLPGTKKPPDDVEMLPSLHRRAVPDTSVAAGQRFAEAFARDAQLRRDASKSFHIAGDGWADDDVDAPAGGHVRLVDSGTFQEVQVDLWAEVDPELHGMDGRLIVGCPFGRPSLNLWYQRRLAGTELGQRLMRELEIEARDVAQLRRAELADNGFQQAVTEAVDGLTRNRPTFPQRLQSKLSYAEKTYQRAVRGTDPAAPALIQYGILAEELLFELAPRGADRPSADELAALVDSWPDCDRTTGRLVREAISALVPPDDEGQGLSVPRHLKAESERFAAHVRAHRSWPSTQRVGTTRQLLPFAAAALWPASGASRALQAALSRHRELWGDLCRAIEFRNPAAHARGERATHGAEDRDRLEAARQSLHRAIDACFPAVDDTAVDDPAVRAPSSEASPPSNPEAPQDPT